MLFIYVMLSIFTISTTAKSLFLHKHFNTMINLLLKVDVRIGTTGQSNVLFYIEVTVLNLLYVILLIGNFGHIKYDNRKENFIECLQMYCILLSTLTFYNYAIILYRRFKSFNFVLSKKCDFNSKLEFRRNVIQLRSIHHFLTKAVHLYNQVFGTAFLLFGIMIFVSIIHSVNLVIVHKGESFKIIFAVRMISVWIILIVSK